MAAGKIRLQANDGKVLSLIAPDGMSADIEEVLRPDLWNSKTTTITPPTNADYTLTATENGYGRLVLVNGAWTTTHNIIVDNTERSFLVDNSSGTYTATVKTSAGTGIAIAAGTKAWLLCDGTNVVESGLAPLASPTFTGTVNGITKTMVGLGNVDNTTDLLKPLSTATINALNLKAPLASPTFTGTVVLPSTTSIGTITNTELSYIDGVTSSVQTQLNAKANLASPALTGTPTAPTPTLGDNTTKVATTAFVLANAPTVTIASTAEAQAGTDNTKVITPLRLHETMLGGVSQTWQDLKASRSVGVTYTNTTGKPIFVAIEQVPNNSVNGYRLYVNSIKVGEITSSSSNFQSKFIYGIVPNGSTYQLNIIAGTPAILTWSELR